MKNQQGFTLIEIAITLVVIGLLIGGVLKGQELISAAQVKNTISSMDELKASMLTFKDRFHAQPGDMSQASKLIGNGAIDCSWECDDGLIQPWKNTSLVTNHLAAANLYDGSFATAEENKAPNSRNSPTNPWGGTMFVAYWNQYNSNGRPARTAVNGIYTGGSIASFVLAEIDHKIDDGNPRTGAFRSAWPKLNEKNCIKGQNWITTNGSEDCAAVSLY